MTSSDKKKRTALLKGTMPAVADYDGDGKWDFGAVAIEKGNLSWTIKTSTNAKVETFTFGKSADRVLVGCRFNRSDRHSLATVSGNLIQARAVSYRGVKKSRIKGSSLGELLGCADITQDGIDEIIFSNPSQGGMQTVLQYYDIRRGKAESLTTVPRISSASVLERQNGEPVIALVNNIPSRKAIQLFSPVGATVSPETFFASLFTDIIGGGVIKNQEIVDVFLSQNSGDTSMNQISLPTWPKQALFGVSERGHRPLKQFSGRAIAQSGAE